MINKILLLPQNLLFLLFNLFYLTKTVTIAILSLLFFSQIGYRFVYMLEQHQLKEQAEKQLLSTINENLFEPINETENGNKIVWEEEGKEFSLNGQMYDVAKKVIVNGQTILYCLNDKKEGLLIEAMVKKIKDSTGNSTDNKNHHSTIKFHVSDFIMASEETAISAIVFMTSYPGFTTSIPFNSKEIITPPPNNDLYF